MADAKTTKVDEPFSPGNPGSSGPTTNKDGIPPLIPEKKNQKKWTPRKRTSQDKYPRQQVKDNIIDPSVRKAKADVAKDDTIWQTGPYSATHPVQRNYSQNADFSTFPILLERTYQDLEMVNPRVRREMPFCAFQHVCTSVLNATIIDHIRMVHSTLRIDLRMKRHQWR